MRPWYLDAVGFGATPSPAYAQAIVDLQALSNWAPPQTSGGVLSGQIGGGGLGQASLPGQAAYTISDFLSAVSQFSPGDVQAVQSTGPYQTLVAQMNAVIANGDFSPGSDQSTTNYYTSKGNYNVASVAAAANQLIGFVSGLTGGGGSTPSNLPSNSSTFVPVAPLPTKILTSKPGNIVVVAAGGQVVGGPVAAIGPNGSPLYNPATGVTTNNPPSPGWTPPAPPVNAAVTTDPSTGATTVTTTNPDGSTTTTTDNGPGGEPTSVTTPPPYFGFFPAPRDCSGALVLALGIGAIAIGLLDLFVNSKEGEKALAVVAKPVDDAAKAVGIPDLPELIPDLSLPEFGPTLNPIRRRRRRNPEQQTRSGKLTRYGFSVGGIERKGNARISYEHGMFNVRGFTTHSRKHVNESFKTAAAARKFLAQVARS